MKQVLSRRRIPSTESQLLNKILRQITLLHRGFVRLGGTEMSVTEEITSLTEIITV